MTGNPMRRRERAIDDPETVLAIIAGATVCRVGFDDDGEPYVVPLNFGWEPARDGRPARFWFHSATAGRKARLLAGRPRVCVQLERDGGLVSHPDRACAWTQRYASVMAWGAARAARDAAEARHGLDVLMRHHAGRGGWNYPDGMLDQCLVWCVEVDRLTAKAHDAEEEDAETDAAAAGDPEDRGA